MKLILPVRDILITQPFGVNYLDFYKKLGMDGHNGIDFLAKNGCPVLAAQSGTVVYSGKDYSGGISVEILSSLNGDGYKTIYYHLLETKINQGQTVKAGKVIGLADNTGKYTTGSHLHFGLKKIFNSITINKHNGYRGAIDPAPFFKEQYGKHWDKSAAYHRYGRRQVWKAEWKMRFKNIWLHRQLIAMGRHPLSLKTEEVNALVYGGWDWEAVKNPAMRYNWAYLKKDEIKSGKIPFLK